VVIVKYTARFGVPWQSCDCGSFFVIAIINYREDGTTMIRTAKCKNCGETRSELYNVLIKKSDEVYRDKK
jgi:hypothetical protein